MREIKFRVWTGATMEHNVTAGKFGAFYVNPGAKGDGLDEKDTACLSPSNTIYSSATPVMQYTGLKDRNGKEIYEGDILEHAESFSMSHWQVIFELGFFGGKPVNISRKRGRIKGRLGPLAYLPASIEIIGNIYENPELLTLEENV